MLFSDYFNVDKKVVDDYGAVNISLLADTPLFIDPLLIYSNDDPQIRSLYPRLSNYLRFLDKIAINNPTEQEIKYYFEAKEIKENWLGLCTSGNQGSALGKDFAHELFSSIKTICESESITDDIHIEKMFLVKHGVGKDRISDWTTNIIVGFLADYTEKFARQFIAKEKCKEFEIKKYSFDYVNGIFIKKIVYLPFVVRGNKIQFVLLTPKSVLRREEQEISFSNFENDFGVLRKTLPNDELRFEINKLYEAERKKIYDKRYEEEKVVSTADLKGLEKEFISMVIEEYPEIYDYFIKSKETDSCMAKENAEKEVNAVLETINENEIVQKDAFGFSLSIDESKTAYEEGLFRVNYFKNQIENNGLWKNLYYDGKPIQKEEDIQRLFALSWCRSHYRFSPESNCGVGPVDFLISFGFKNATVIEFKLASNSRLRNVFNQVDGYRKSHRCSGKSIIVVFFFNDAEKEKAMKVQRDADNMKYQVVLVDCDSSNKKSASKL